MTRVTKLGWATLWLCVSGATAVAQTPAVLAPVTVGAPAAVPATVGPSLADSIAQLDALRAAAHRSQLLEVAKNLAVAPAVTGPIEKETATSAQDETPPPGKLGQEGIRVHGHWVIDVKNPDGTLAGHHDFQNSLLPGGSFALAGMLAGELVPANWMISLSGKPPICATSPSNVCGIVQSQSTQPAATYCAGGSGTCVTGLTTAFNSSVSTFTLTGSLIATQDGSINQVATDAGICFTAPGATFSPQSCAVGTPAGSSGVVFSSTAITQIPVASGQTVMVTVIFSFS